MPWVSLWSLCDVNTASGVDGVHWSCQTSQCRKRKIRSCSRLSPDCESKTSSSWASAIRKPSGEEKAAGVKQDKISSGGPQTSWMSVKVPSADPETRRALYLESTRKVMMTGHNESLHEESSTISSGWRAAIKSIWKTKHQSNCRLSQTMSDHDTPS